MSKPKNISNESRPRTLNKTCVGKQSEFSEEGKGNYRPGLNTLL